MANQGSSQNARCSRINSMLSVWYGIIFGCLQAFLIVQNVRRFVWFAELSWPFQRTPYLELNSYIVLTGVSVLMLPFFLAAAILQIGNTANDNRLLGKDLNARDEWAPVLLPSMLYQDTKRFFQNVWTHSGPTAPLIHIVSAFCLLLPQTLMEAVLLKFGYLSRDSIWRTDLDALIPQGDRNAILKFLNTVTEVGKTDGSGNLSLATTLLDHSPGSMRLEYLNYALALAIFSLRYASVFWHANKAFATVFSIQVLLNCAHAMVSYSAFTVIYKVHVLGSITVLHQMVPFLLNSYVALLLHVISSTILLGSGSVLYTYGYGKVVSFVEKKRRTTCITGARIQRSRLRAFLPHCSALAIFLALAATQSPLIHDATLLYNLTLDNCLLAFIICAGIHFIVWIFLWIVLSAKRDWKFNVSVNIGNIRLDGFESLKLAAEITLNDPSKTGTITPLSSSVLVLSGGKAFAITEASTQREILETIHGAPSSSHEDSACDRLYWPRACPPPPTSNSLDDEIQPWLKDSKEATARNKVTFYDGGGSPRKYASVPLTRGGAMKRSFRDKEYSEVNQVPDEGDYAVLKRGKGCLKSQLPREIQAEDMPQMGRVLPSSSGNKYEGHYLTTALRTDSNFPQATPRSVMSSDSGYPGTESACRSESRSASSTGSPPDRTVQSDSSSGVHSSSTFASSNQQRPQSTSCCPEECCSTETYGLVRRESLRYPSNPPNPPMYESGMMQGRNPPTIYESRCPPKSQAQLNRESVNGESPNRRAESSVTPCLDSPPYQPSSVPYSPSSSYNQNPLVPSKYTNINTANELVERQGITNVEKIYGQTTRVVSFQPCDATSPIMSTPFGRCTNMRLSSFGEPLLNGKTDNVPQPQNSGSETFIPPVPPPLPPLSFTFMQRSQGSHSGDGRLMGNQINQQRYS